MRIARIKLRMQVLSFTLALTRNHDHSHWAEVQFEPLTVHPGWARQKLWTKTSTGKPGVFKILVLNASNAFASGSVMPESKPQSLFEPRAKG